MAVHNEVGTNGEQLAADYLSTLGYEILVRNWRYSRYEIDLVVVKDNVLHIIEVKTRRSNRFGFPEEAVNTKKFRCLMKAGAAFLYQYPHWKKIQYDVLSITILANKPVEYFLIEDVYL